MSLRGDLNRRNLPRTWQRLHQPGRTLVLAIIGEIKDLEDTSSRSFALFGQHSGHVNEFF